LRRQPFHSPSSLLLFQLSTSPWAREPIEQVLWQVVFGFKEVKNTTADLMEGEMKKDENDWFVQSV
jgi:hypothetical protein